jgi:hypothetical protein
MSIKRNCNNCWTEYTADERNLKRWWWLCCNKSCAAKLREKSKSWYNPIKVEENNKKRANWNNVENEYFQNKKNTYNEIEWFEYTFSDI